MQPFKIVVEKHTDGYVAYPLGLKGVIIGQGDTYEESVEDVTSAIQSLTFAEPRTKRVVSVIH